MAVTPVPSVTPLPTPPSTSDPGNFDVRADAFLGALANFQTQTNALATNVFNNATDAANSATTAVSARDTAVSAKDTAVSSASTATSAKDTAVSSASTATSAKDVAVTAKNDAVSARDTAVSAKDTAVQAASDAQVYATQQFNATSTTSHSLTAGSKTFSIQAGKGFVVGQYLSVARTSAPTQFMQGFVTAYNKTTGDLTLTIDYLNASGGPFTDWTLALIGRAGQSGGRNVVIISANTVAVEGNDYVFDAVCTLTMPSSPTTNGTTGFSNGTGGPGPMVDFGSVPVKRKIVGVLTMTNATDAAVVKYTGSSTIGYTEV